MKNNICVYSLKAIAILLIVTNFNFAFGQSIQTKTYDDFLSDFIGSNSKSIIASSNENKVTGSAYLSDEFAIGSILTTQNIKYSDVLLRYNIYTDEMEFKTKENSIFAISRPGLIKEIQLGEEVFIFCRSKIKKAGYYTLKSSGKVQLLSKYNITFQAATPSLAYKKASPPHYLRTFNEFFIRIDETKLVLLTNKKGLKSVFKDNSDELIAFIKKEKIKFRREKDLIKLVEFINKMG